MIRLSTFTGLASRIKRASAAAAHERQIMSSKVDWDFTVTTARNDKFEVHKAVIRRNKFFDAALKHDFKSSTNNIDMLDDDANALACLLEHLYSCDSRGGASSENNYYFHKHVRVVLLARKYDATILEREAINAARYQLQQDAENQDLSDEDVEAIKTLYEVTEEGDGLRLIVVEAFSEHKTNIVRGKPAEVEQLTSSCPQFLLELFPYESAKLIGE